MDHLRDSRPKTYHAEISESPNTSTRRSGDPDRDMIREMMLALRTASKFSRDISNEDLEKLCREAFYQGKHRDLKWLEQQMRTMAPPPAPVIRQPRNDSEEMVTADAPAIETATTATGRIPNSLPGESVTDANGASSTRLTGATASAVSNRKGRTDDSYLIKDKKRQDNSEEDEFEDESLDDDDLDEESLDDDEDFSDEDDLEIDDAEDSDAEISRSDKPSSNRHPTNRKNKSSDGGYLHRSLSMEVTTSTSAAVEATGDPNQKEIKDHLATVFPTPVSHISSREDMDPVILRHRQWKDSVLSARLELSSGRANLCNEDLSGFDLSGVDLSCAIFRGAKLCGTNFKGANLAGADFSSADLQGADLRNANLRRCKFQRADLREAEIEGAQIDGADFNWAKRPACLEDPKKQNNTTHTNEGPADDKLSSQGPADQSLALSEEDSKPSAGVAAAADESSLSAESSFSGK